MKRNKEKSYMMKMELEEEESHSSTVSSHYKMESIDERKLNWNDDIDWSLVKKDDVKLDDADINEWDVTPMLDCEEQNAFKLSYIDEIKCGTGLILLQEVFVR